MADLGKLMGRAMLRPEPSMKASNMPRFGGFTAPSARPGMLPLRSMPQEAVNHVCGAEGCASAWRKPWKNRTRPIFEDEWGCSSKCIQKIVAATVRRETGEGVDADTTPHRHRVPLGLVLLAQGWITHPQLRAALDAQRNSGHGRIGDWLAESCGLDQQRITRGLGMQWNCPVFTTDGFTPGAMALVMPKRFVVEFGLVPLRVAGRSVLYLAAQDKLNAAPALAIEHMSGLKVESGLLGEARFQEVREGILAAESVPVTMGNVPDEEALALRITRRLEQGLPLASRLVRVHQYYWLRTWMEAEAFGGTGTLPSTMGGVRDHLFTVGPAHRTAPGVVSSSRA